MLKLPLVLTVISLNAVLIVASPPEAMVPVILLPDEEYRCCSGNNRDQPTLYCYQGTQKTLTNTWRTVSAFVDMRNPDRYELYKGTDEYDVWAQYESSQSKWRLNIFNWGYRRVALHPFGTTCLGIRTSKNYILRTQVTPVNNLLVGMFIVGVLLFFSSPLLVHNTIFYYFIGITVGVLASVLVFLYFIITLLPLKRPAMLGVMAGGSTIIFYFFQSLVDNLLVLVPMYTQFVYAYLIVSGLISFVVCYRFGPLSNPRSKNLIQWSLQVCSLALVYYSSHMQEVTVSLAIAMMVLYKVPLAKWTIAAIRKCAVNADERKLVPRMSTVPVSRQTFRRHRRSRFLNDEEYREQARVETTRGLEEMREYCRINPVRCRTLQRIDAKRFARFISGEPHLSREEVEARSVLELLTDEEE